MNKIEATIDLIRLRKTLRYDADAGHFVSLAESPNQLASRWRPGRIVGGKNAYHDPKGYIRLRVFGMTVMAHRLVWFHVHGQWPKEQIDHINHVRDDNRIVNLRECTNAENRQNIRPEGYGASGYLGVYFHKDAASRPWGAMITIKGKYEHLGQYETPEEASVAYLAAKEKLHQFATTGVSEIRGAIV